MAEVDAAALGVDAAVVFRNAEENELGVDWTELEETEVAAYS